MWVIGYIIIAVIVMIGSALIFEWCEPGEEEDTFMAGISIGIFWPLSVPLVIFLGCTYYVFLIIKDRVFK